MEESIRLRDCSISMGKLMVFSSLNPGTGKYQCVVVRTFEWVRSHVARLTKRQLAEMRLTGLQTISSQRLVEKELDFPP